MKKTDFTYGVLAGFLLGVIFMGVITLCAPEILHGTEILLNSGDYRIDTTTIIHNTDTAYKYEFIKIK